MQFSRENERPQAASSGRKTQSVCDGHFKILTYTHRDIIYIYISHISIHIIQNHVKSKIYTSIVIVHISGWQIH
jgi:hypothetical protein